MRRRFALWQTRRVIRRDLRRLADLGLVEPDGIGWTLTPFGRRLANAQKGQ